MNYAMPSRTEPAGWTPAHLAERAYLASLGVDTSDSHPETLVRTTLVEDADGLPAGLAVNRLPVVVKITGCCCGMTHYPRRVPATEYSDHDGPGDLDSDGEAGHDG